MREENRLEVRLRVAIAVASVAVLGALCGGPTLVGVGLAITGVTVTGPASLGANSTGTYTVSYTATVNGFTGSLNFVVKDSDVLPEINLVGDETLVAQTAPLPASGTQAMSATFTLSCGAALFGQTVRGAAGDSGEGGPNLLGPDPAEVYAEVNAVRSPVLLVTCP